MRTRALLSAWVIAAMAAVLPSQQPSSPFGGELDLGSYFRLTPHDAAEPDVAIVRESMRHTIVGLQSMFGVERVDRLLRNLDCEVHVFGKATARIDESTALLVTSVQDGKYKASIEVLAASAFSPGYRDVAGFDGGKVHQHKILMHEYSTVLLDRLTRDKPKGWSYFSAPPWFVQGYPEFLSIESLPTAIDAFVARQTDPDRVRFQPQFAVKDPYVDGATLVHFLHESFGGERVRALLDAPHAMFDEALSATLGVSLRELEARWKRWRDQSLTRLDWRKALRAATSPQQVAEAVEGLHLRRLEPEERDMVGEALQTLTGDAALWRTPKDGEPHRIYRVQAGTTRWILLVRHAGNWPRVPPRLVVHPFQDGWQRLPVIECQMDRHLVLGDVRLEQVAVVPEPVLVVQLGGRNWLGDFHYREHLFYAVQGDRIALLRREHVGYSAMRASFTGELPTVRPPLLQRTAAQWIDLLSSQEPVDVLEALTWLGGIHLASTTARGAAMGLESVADSQLWEAVRDDPRTKARLEELAKTGSRWVRQGAALALEPAAR